tara:strand:+ start:1644 stop:2057 length:414 start_codon:yes stop_codon:yes gene_type:complete
MTKFKIDVRVKENENIIWGNLSFKNLDKLELENLDILIYLLIRLFECEENNINLVQVDILYKVDCCEDYKMVLSFTSIDILLDVFYAFSFSNKKAILEHKLDKDVIQKKENESFEAFSAVLDKFNLNETFGIKFIPM